MRSVNMVVLVGNVGNDPEVRDAGQARVAGFSLATTYGWGSGDERQEKTEWHRIVAWQGLAEITERYISKGDRLYIQGRIQYRQWEDKEGVTRYTTEIVATEIVMLGSPKGERATGRAPTHREYDSPDFPSEYGEPGESSEQPTRRAPAKRAPATRQAAPAKRAPAKRQ